MARIKVKPMVVKPVPQPSDHPNSVSTFRIAGAEIQMFDLYAREATQASGADCDLYQRNLSGSNIDPLYSEPIQNAFIGPYVLRVNIEWAEFTPESSEEGMRALFPSGAWIPRKSLELIGARDPREGDVIRFWKLPYFDNRAVQNQTVPNAGYYFDLIKVNDDGHLTDDSAFVAFRCDLKRRTDFSPENLLTPPKLVTDPC